MFITLTCSISQAVQILKRFKIISEFFNFSMDLFKNSLVISYPTSMIQSIVLHLYNRKSCKQLKTRKHQLQPCSMMLIYLVAIEQNFQPKTPANHLGLFHFCEIWSFSLVKPVREVLCNALKSMWKINFSRGGICISFLNAPKSKNFMIRFFSHFQNQKEKWEKY